MEDELIKTMKIFKIENRLEMLNKKLESSLPFEKCYISFEIIKLKEKKHIFYVFFPYFSTVFLIIPFRYFSIFIHLVI